MRKIFSGSLVAAALGTAVMIAGALPASAQVSNALATGDNGALLTLAKNETGGGHASGGGGGSRMSGGASNGGAMIRNNSAGLSSHAQSDVRIRDRDRRQMSNNNNWNNNGDWRHRRHFRNGVGIGFGFYDYDAPYYAYAPGYDEDAVAYCMSRFRSYDPGSGTYLGYDGLQHPCP